LPPAELLEEMVRFEAMHTKALVEGYDRKPELVERWRRMVVAQYREDRLGTGEALPSVSEEEIRASYETNQASYTLPAARRANVIFLSTPRVLAPEKREEVRLRAEAILAEARVAEAPEALAALVARVSEHQATRYRAGDAGWLSLEDKSPAWNAKVVAALFEIAAPGGFAPVVDTESGFYLVRLAEERTARTKPIGEVREAIRYRLARDKQFHREEKLFTEAKAGLDIQINHALLNSIVPKTAPRETRTPTLPKQAANQ
jgi:hypothetical protein